MSGLEEYKKWYKRWYDSVHNLNSKWCDGSCSDRLDNIKQKLTEEEKEKLKELGYLLRE